MERGLSPSPEPSPYDSSGAEHDDAVEGVAGVEQTEAEAPTGMDEMACDVEQHQHVPPQQTEASPVSPLSEDGDFRQQEEQEEEEHEQEEEEKLQSPEEPAPPRSSSSLSQALLRDPLARLPQAGAEMVFGRCLAFLQRAMEDGECSEQVEGLFMLQPSLTDVRRLQRRILSGESIEEEEAADGNHDGCGSEGGNSSGGQGSASRHRASPHEAATLLLQHLQVRPEPLIPFALYEPFLDCCHYGAAAEEEEEVVETTGAEKGAGEAAEAGGDMTAPLPPPGPPPSGAGGEEEEEGEGEGGGEPKTPPPTPDRAQRPQAEEEEGLPPAVVVRMAVSAEGEGEGGPAQQEGEEGRDGGEKENASAVTSAAAGAGAEAAGWGGGGKGASGPRATIALDRLSGMLSRLPPRSKGQIEALLGLVRRVATAPTGGGEELHGPTVAGLGAVLGPLLARPKGAAHLSLRHARELPRLASLGSALIQHCHTLQQPEQECSHSGGSNHLSPSSCPASPLGSSLGMATAPAFLSSSSGHGAGLSPAKSGRRSLSPCQSPRHQQPQQHLPHGSPSPPSAPDDGSGQQNERSKQQEEEQRRRQRQEREEARAVLQGQLLPGLVRRFLNGASDDGPLPSAGNGQVGYQVGRSVTHPQYNASLLLLQAHKQQCGGDSVFSSSIASVASSSASHPPRPASPYSCPLGSLGLDALSLLDSSPQRRSRSGSDDSSGGLGMRQRRRLISGCRALQEQIKRFEEGYKTEHGRFPRGAEKAALASTYAQYRAWKRLVKEDAARTIQRCVKGHLVRRRLRPVLPSPPVAAAAAPTPTTRTGTSQQQQQQPQPKPSSSLLLQLEAPRIIPATEAAAAATTPTPRPLQQRQRQQQHQLPHLSPASQAELKQLFKAKKEEKERLRRYDAVFAAAHGGRLPTKAEKEPVRPLYERYARLKQRIKALQQGSPYSSSVSSSWRMMGRTTGVAARGSSVSNSRDSSRSGRTSPSSSSAIGLATDAARGGSNMNTSRSSSSSHSSSSGRVSPSSRVALAQDLPRLLTGVPMPLHSPRRQHQQQQAAAPIVPSAFTTSFASSSSSSMAATTVLYRGRARPLAGAAPAPAPSSSSSGSSTNSSSRRLGQPRVDDARVEQQGAAAARAAASTAGDSGVLVATLKAEGAALKKRLRAFERTFVAANGRKVSTMGDLMPVQEEYRRYKEIKALLPQLSAGAEADV